MSKPHPLDQQPTRVSWTQEIGRLTAEESQWGQNVKLGHSPANVDI